MKEKVKKFLKSMFYQKRVPSAILIYGKEGVGKRDLAFEFAQSLLCLEESYPPCGICQSCKKMQSFLKKSLQELAFFGEDKKGKSVFLYLRGEHPDFVYLTPEKSEIRIDQVRGIRDFVYLSPALSKKKIVFIHPADSMNQHAQNALLKVLEEPGEDTHFLLVTNYLDKILPTVRSRSFLVEVPPLSREDLSALTGIKDPVILDLSEGSLSIAQRLQEDRELLHALEAFQSSDPLKFYRTALEVEKWELQRQYTLLKALQSFYHRKYLISKADEDRLNINVISQGLEYLSRGLRLGLILFQLKGGTKHALHKG